MMMDTHEKEFLQLTLECQCCVSQGRKGRQARFMIEISGVWKEQFMKLGRTNSLTTCGRNHDINLNNQTAFRVVSKKVVKREVDIELELENWYDALG